MRKLTFLIVALFLPILASAQYRSESDAISIARNFWGNGQANLKAVPQKNIGQAKARASKTNVSTTASNPCYYIINDEANGRFVIVSADERLYNILGYSDNGTFAGDSIPLGLADILIGYDRQYDHMLHDVSSASISSKSEKNGNRGVRIEPLIKTKWGQSSPYYNDCPKYMGVLPSATGCVATAMSQVMNYHRYPTTGMGHTSYISQTLDFDERMDFSSCNFDWVNMTEVYDDQSTDEQKDAVAKLMHACGIAVHMDYTHVESGATANDMAYALHKYFGYNKNLKYYERKYFSTDEWNSIILKDLSEGLPILYSGMGESTDADGSKSRYGHQFILDGYDGESKYHFNWGWEGLYDGYFELTALNHSENSNFSLDQAMVCNVSPETKGETEDIFFATAFLIGKSTVNVGGILESSFDPICYSPNTNTYDAYFDGTFGIGVFDLDHKFVKSLYSDTGGGRFRAGTTYREPLSPTLYFDSSTFKDGSKFYIAPYAKSSGATEYTWIRTTYGLWDYYLAEVRDGKVTLTTKGVPAESQPELKTGTLYANAYNINNEIVHWSISLTKDSKEDNKYWLDNMDPSIDGADNHVYGILDKTGTLLIVPQGQPLGDNMVIANYSNNDDIRCLISSIDNTLTIPEAWGCMKTGNTNAEKLSCYTYTEISYIPKNEEYITLEKPTVIVQDGVLQILCGTPDTKIYYTLDGSTPTDRSTLYVEPVNLNGNCTIKAIAILDDSKMSEIVEYKVTSFTVSNPVISVANNRVIIQSATTGAKVYYTLDGSDPKNKQNLYIEEFLINCSCVIKAYAIKDNYNDSEIIEQSAIYITNGEENSSITIADNIAGKLNERLYTSDIIGKSILTITGELNGTDFLYLYQIMDNGNISDLNLAGARIVSGGKPYFTPYVGDGYCTENDVIGTNMFYKLKSLVSLSLPATTKKIDIFGISECNNIGRLDLPEDCIDLNMSAIYNCKNLNILYIGKDLKMFDGDAISNCQNLTEFIVDNANEYLKSKDGILFSKNESTLIKYPCGLSDHSYTVPSGVQKIGNSAFQNAKFSEVTLPDGLKSIESSAFNNCNNLLHLEMPNSISNIGTFAFWNCSSLHTVELSDNVSEIPDYSFRDCRSLREFSIGKRVGKISEDAFPGCTLLQKFNVDSENNRYCSVDGILYTKDMSTLIACPIAYYSTNIIVPEGVSVIGDNAFYNCSNVEKVTLPESLDEIGSFAFNGCKNLKTLILPKKLEEIGMYAFNGCKKLESLAIPEGVSILKMGVAEGCSKLSFLSLPKTIEEVDIYAFANCESLQIIRCDIVDINSLTVEANILDDSYSSFSKIPDNCTWYVPYGCKEAYKIQPWWVTTWNIEENQEAGVSTISMNNTMDVSVADGCLTITAGSDSIIHIFNLNGMLVKKFEMKNGMTEIIELPTGIYFINDSKILVK